MLHSLKYAAGKLMSKLEEINNQVFTELQLIIRTSKYKNGFKDLINTYVDLDTCEHGDPEEPGYDDLDILINGLFPCPVIPENQLTLHPEMVAYQKTPVRIIFDMVSKIPFGKGDVFVDLGSGLGQVAILFYLLTGIPAIGIEFEPAFCAYARDCLAALHLSEVSFVNADARKADYSKGTIFFMYTPFKGEMLQDVLNRLRTETLTRKITVITYGPCTDHVALQSWLKFTAPAVAHPYPWAVFTSL